MKKLSLLKTFVIAGIVLTNMSCSNNELDLLEKNESQKVKEISGTFTKADLPLTINFDGKTIIIESPDNINQVQTRAVEWSDTYYAKGNMTQIYDNKKLSVRYGGYAGIFICNVFLFKNEIVLPPNAATARVFAPNPSGFKNYSTQELGVNWGMSSDSRGAVLSFNFYTLRLEYDTAGAQYGKVIPTDGRSINVPYQIGY